MCSKIIIALACLVTSVVLVQGDITVPPINPQTAAQIQIVVDVVLTTCYSELSNTGTPGADQCVKDLKTKCEPTLLVVINLLVILVILIPGPVCGLVTLILQLLVSVVLLVIKLVTKVIVQIDFTTQCNQLLAKFQTDLLVFAQIPLLGTVILLVGPLVILIVQVCIAIVV